MRYVQSAAELLAAQLCSSSATITALCPNSLCHPSVPWKVWRQQQRKGHEVPHWVEYYSLFCLPIAEQPSVAKMRRRPMASPSITQVSVSFNLFLIAFSCAIYSRTATNMQA